MTLRVATIFSIFLILLTGYTSQVRAQSTTADKFTARKLDEFGAVGHCDMGARLDNLAIFLSDLPGATAYIVAYGPGGPGVEANQQQLTHLTEYLVHARGINPEIIKTAYGGRNSDVTQTRFQLWILPPNVAPFEPEKFESNIATFKGKLFEYETYEDFGVWYESSEETMGPGVGRLSHESLADVLQEQKNSIAYIVAYKGEESLPAGWRRYVDQEVENFKRLGIDTSRVKIIFGGRKDQTKLEFWVLPKDAPPPVAAVKDDSTLKQVVMAGELSADFLAFETKQTRSFKTIADVMRTDKRLRVFIAVRLDAPTPPEGEVAKTETEEPVEEESAEDVRPVPPDLTKLIEKWRSDLTTIHKIRNDRIIVIFLPGTEFSSNSISVWFVPKGQPLPDPNAEEEEEVAPTEETDPPAKPN